MNAAEEKLLNRVLEYSEDIAELSKAVTIMNVELQALGPKILKLETGMELLDKSLRAGEKNGIHLRVAILEKRLKRDGAIVISIIVAVISALILRMIVGKGG